MPTEPVVNHDHDLSVTDAVVTCDSFLDSMRHVGTPNPRVVVTQHERKAIARLLKAVRDVHNAVT